VTDHSARSLKSNDLAHFADFYPRRSRNVRPTNVNALISVPVERADDEYNDDDDDDESFYRIRRRGLFRWGGFRRVSRCANRLVGNRRTMRGGAMMTRRRLKSGITRLKKSIFDKFINHTQSRRAFWINFMIIHHAKIRLDARGWFRRKCFRRDEHFLCLLRLRGSIFIVTKCTSCLCAKLLLRYCKHTAESFWDKYNLYSIQSLEIEYLCIAALPQYNIYILFLRVM